MTINQLQAFKRDNSLTWQQVADICCVTVACVYQWQAGSREVPGSCSRLMSILASDPQLLKTVLLDF